MVMFPERETELLVFDAMLTFTMPLPVPVPPEAIVAQARLSEVAQAQPA